MVVTLDTLTLQGTVNSTNLESSMHTCLIFHSKAAKIVKVGELPSYNIVNIIPSPTHVQRREIQ